MSAQQHRQYLIQRSYFMRGSAVEIAIAMRKEFGFDVTAPDIEAEWRRCADDNPLFCQRRPEFGFDYGDDLPALFDTCQKGRVA
jgi:hypothetical protein